MSQKKRICSIIIVSVLAVGLAFLGAVVYCFPIKYREEITQYASQFDVNPTLIASVINAESHFRADAVSPKGAIGLMQLMPATAEELANKLGRTDFVAEDLLDPATNIMLGTFYLQILIDEFGEEKTALCAYNAGPNKVRSWLKSSTFSTDGTNLAQIPYPETRDYSEKIAFFKKIYAVLF